MTVNDGLLAPQPKGLIRMDDGQLVIMYPNGIQLKTSRHSTNDRWIDSSNSEIAGEMFVRLRSASKSVAMTTNGDGESYMIDVSTGSISQVDTDSLACRSAESPSAPVIAQQPDPLVTLWFSADSLWLMPTLEDPCLSFSNLPASYTGWAFTYLRDDGGWWIGTYSNNLWRLEVEAADPTHVVHSYQIPIPGGRVRTLWQDGDTIWIGTSGAGLLKYSITDQSSVVFNRYHSDNTKISGSVVSDFAQLSESLFLVGTRAGLDIVNSETNTATPVPVAVQVGSDIPNTEIEFLHVDQWGTVWVGHKEGISYTSIESILSSTIPLEAAGVSGPVSAISYDANSDRIWIGANGAIFSISLDGSGIRHEVRIDEVTGFAANNTVTDIFFSNGRSIASIGSHGIIVLDDSNTWVSASLAPVEATQNERSRFDAVRALGRTGNQLFVATEGAGLLTTTLDAVGNVVHQIDEPTGLISSLSVTRDGHILVGSYTRGAFWYQPDSLTFAKALPWNNVNSILDRSMVHDVASTIDDLYLAATSGGLIYWTARDSTWSGWSTEHGLPADLINNVSIVDSNSVWFSTDKTLCRWLRDSGTPECLALISAQSPESIQPTSMAVLDSQILLGATNSVRVVPIGLFDELERRRNKPITLTLASDHGDFVSLNDVNDPLEFDPLASVVSLKAELSSFSGADAVHFRYQLLGVTDGYIVEPGTVLDKDFFELPHRHELYSFDVEVWDASGRMYATQVSFRLPVPFWKTLWFLLTGSVALVGLSSWRAASWLSRRRNEARELQLALASGREQERSNLSRQIHDLSLQNLYVIKLQMNQIDDDISPELFSQINDSLTRSIDELRRLCGELLPPSLGPFGLESAVRSFLQRIEGANPDLEIISESTVSNEPDTDISIAIIRALQTSVANVVRHANAKTLEISIESNPNSIALTVRDDGSGFSVPSSLISLARKRHFGLLGLHELAKQYGGELHIESSSGKGTLIQFSVSNRQPPLSQ
jgi:signal transduction histidine kinase/ligand-binding sensor domain-containing protein